MGRAHETAVVTAIRVQGACTHSMLVCASTCKGKVSSIINSFINWRSCGVWALGVSDMIGLRPGRSARGFSISNMSFRISGSPATASRVARLLRASAFSARLHCLCCSCLCLFVVVPCLLPIALRYKVEAVVTALRIVSGWGMRYPRLPGYIGNHGAP